MSATGPSERVAAVSPVSRSRAVKSTPVRNGRVAADEIEPGEFGPHSGQDRGAAAGQVGRPQRQRRGEDERVAVEPAVDAEPVADRHRPGLLGRARAGDRLLGLLQRRRDEVAQVQQDRGHVGRVVGGQLLPPVAQRAERVGQQPGGVEGGHPGGRVQAEQDLQLGAGVAERGERVPDQGRGHLPGEAAAASGLDRSSTVVVVPPNSTSSSSISDWAAPPTTFSPSRSPRTSSVPVCRSLAASSAPLPLAVTTTSTRAPGASTRRRRRW